MIGAAGAALLLSVGLLCIKRIDTAAWVCALQGLCAAVALGGSAVAVAVLAFAVNGVVLPLVLVRMKDAAMPALRGNVLSAWAMALALLVISVAATIGAGEMLAAGVAVTLLGILLAVLRSDGRARVLGLLSSQNGLVLVAGATPDLSRTAALAVAVPLVPGLVLAGMWLRR